MENSPNCDPGVVNSAEENCAICLDKVREKKTLTCLHSFCSECINSVFKSKPACPICNTYHGKYTGNQPVGTMNVTRSWMNLPGFDRCGTIVIQYSFPAGIQGVRLTGTGHMNRPHADKIVSVLWLHLSAAVHITSVHQRTLFVFVLQSLIKASGLGGTKWRHQTIKHFNSDVK